MGNLKIKSSPGYWQSVKVQRNDSEEALPNLASEKFHTDMFCIGIGGKTFLTELKL